jgi:hypothetical protein
LDSSELLEMQIEYMVYHIMYVYVAWLPAHRPHKHTLYDIPGARGGAVVEALRYKPEGRGIDSR